MANDPYQGQDNPNPGVGSIPFKSKAKPKRNPRVVGGPTATVNKAANNTAHPVYDPVDQPSTYTDWNVLQNTRAAAGATQLSDEQLADNRKHTVIALGLAFILSTITHGIGKWPV